MSGNGGFEQAYQDPYTGEWVFPSQQHQPQAQQPQQHAQQAYGNGYQEQRPHAQHYGQEQGYQQGYQQQPDPYAAPYDPYAGYQQAQDPYYGRQQDAYQQDTYQQGTYQQDHGQQQGYEQQQYAQPAYTEQPAYAEPAPAPAPAAPPPPREPVAPRIPPQGRPAPKPGAGGAGDRSKYTGDDFEFVDDAEESTDVIDWVKFSETRGERRDERRRKLRSRAVALAVAVVLVGGGAAGYLFATGKIGGGGPATVAAANQREVVAVHLHDLNKNIYSALLISEPSSAKGVTLLLPGTLGIPQDSGPGLLALSTAVDSVGTSGTRTGINNLLGTDVSATWNVQTPFLQNLVDLLGGVKIDSDVAINLNGKQVITPGRNATVNGAAAMAFATYKAKGESDAAQLKRFGIMLQALVAAMPTDPTAAAGKITQMGAVDDPSLSDARLGALLAKLSTDARGGAYSTETLPVQANGTLAGGAADMVSALLAGKVNSQNGQTASRIQLIDANGRSKDVDFASAAMSNAGYVLVPGTTKEATRSTSVIEYSDDSRLKDAQAVANTLGLPASVVKKVTSPLSTDLRVTLGRDYKGGA